MQFVGLDVKVGLRHGGAQVLLGVEEQRRQCALGKMGPENGDLEEFQVN